MKKQVLILMMSLMALTVMAEKTKKEVTFNVPMTCEKCVSKVEKNIAFEKGVKDLDCDLEAKTVRVTYIAEKTNVAQLQKGFEKIGFTATVADGKCCKSKACDNKCNAHDKKAEDKKCCSEKKCNKEAKQSSCCKKS